MANALQQVAWESCLIEPRPDRALKAYARRKQGIPNPMIGILAFFGGLQPNPWQCNDAVHAALAMRAAIREYDAGLAREGLPPLAVGIGIHCGPGLSGLIGSRERMEYAFVGRTVNLAARVQAFTRIHKADIPVTEALRAELDPRFVLVPMPRNPSRGLPSP